MLTPGGIYIDRTLQSGATATGAGTAVNCCDLSKGAHKFLLLQVVGITTATITWQGTLDGTNWADVDVTPLAATDTPATTAAANGLYRADVTGLTALRANITAYTSGTITVTGRLTAQ